MSGPAEDAEPPVGELWLELPPHSSSAPSRLIVFLHGAGSSPESLVPLALAWQLKFPGAVGALMQGLRESAAHSGRDWFHAGVPGEDRLRAIDAAISGLRDRVASAQTSTGHDGARTMIVGYSQGATMALELVRRHPSIASIVVGYAARLARPIRSEERITADVHLVHGGLDSLVPVVHARQAFRGLQAIGTRVTLDVTEEGSHAIDQHMVVLGTTRAMQSVFRGRRAPPRHPTARSGSGSRTLH